MFSKHLLVVGRIFRDYPTVSCVLHTIEKVEIHSLEFTKNGEHCWAATLRATTVLDSLVCKASM